MPNPSTRFARSRQVQKIVVEIEVDIPERLPKPTIEQVCSGLKQLLLDMHTCIACADIVDLKPLPIQTGDVVVPKDKWPLFLAAMNAVINSAPTTKQASILETALKEVKEI